MLSQLRRQGIQIVAFIDDTLIIDDTEAECQNATDMSITEFDNKGVTVHPDKSILSPTQVIDYLGFTINSVTMQVKPSTEQCLRIATTAATVRKATRITIRQLAEIVGTLVAASPGVQYATLYVKQLEHEKDAALKRNRGNFDADTVLSRMARSHLKWWELHISTAFRSISLPKPSLTIRSDSSNYGWGAFSQGVSAGGGMELRGSQQTHQREGASRGPPGTHVLREGPPRHTCQT